MNSCSNNSIEGCPHRVTPSRSQMGHVVAYIFYGTRTNTRPCGKSHLRSPEQLVIYHSHFSPLRFVWQFRKASLAAACGHVYSPSIPALVDILSFPGRVPPAILARGGRGVWIWIEKQNNGVSVKLADTPCEIEDCSRGRNWPERLEGGQSHQLWLTSQIHTSFISIDFINGTIFKLSYPLRSLVHS